MDRFHTVDDDDSDDDDNTHDADGGHQVDDATVAADARYFRAAALASHKLLTANVVNLPGFIDAPSRAEMLQIALAKPSAPHWIDKRHPKAAPAMCALRAKVLTVLNHLAGTNEMLAHVATAPSRFMVIVNDTLDDELYVYKPKGSILGVFARLPELPSSPMGTEATVRLVCRCTDSNAGYPRLRDPPCTLKHGCASFLFPARSMLASVVQTANEDMRRYAASVMGSPWHFSSQMPRFELVVAAPSQPCLPLVMAMEQDLSIPRRY
jgi:hypothetical protein